MKFSVAQKLPQLWKLANELAPELKAEKYSDWPPMIERIKPLLAPEMTAAIEQVVPGWKNIATLHEGQTAKHTLIVLAICLNLPEYSEASAQTRLEIEWAAVLHDLDKKFARADTAHPFRSAAMAAEIMPSLGFELQPGADLAQIAAWSALVMSAQRPDGERMIHDHSRLAEIIKGVCQIWGEDTPASRVLKVILFHQSLPTLKDWPNAVLMTDDEVRAHLTLDDMNVLGPLLITDSDSWNIFDAARYASLEELRANIAEARQRISV